MPAFPLRQMTVITLSASIAIAVVAPSVSAQTSVKAVFEKYGLLGTFAIDCSKPGSKDNPYWVQRLLDADHVQRDKMSGTLTREQVQFVDKAAEAKPNGITISLTHDGKRNDEVWRIERKTGDGLRYLLVEVSEDGKKLVSGGRNVGDGAQVSWFNKTLGIEFANLSEDLRKKYKIKDTVKGIAITRVDANSPAAEKRLSPGDVIVEIAEEAVTASPDDFQTKIDKLKKDGKSALLLVAGPDGELRFLALGLQNYISGDQSVDNGQVPWLNKCGR